MRCSRQPGARVFVGGNLGTPLIEACAAAAEYEAAVVEVSSFQLEWVRTFRPQVAVLLNLTPDHLDRYHSMEEYGQAKAALLAAQLPGDVAVLNRDDPWVWEQRRTLARRCDLVRPRAGRVRQLHRRRHADLLGPGAGAASLLRCTACSCAGRTTART